VPAELGDDSVLYGALEIGTVDGDFAHPIFIAFEDINASSTFSSGRVWVIIGAKDQLDAQ